MVAGEIFVAKSMLKLIKSNVKSLKWSRQKGERIGRRGAKLQSGLRSEHRRRR